MRSADFSRSTKESRVAPAARWPARRGPRLCGRRAGWLLFGHTERAVTDWSAIAHCRRRHWRLRC